MKDQSYPEVSADWRCWQPPRPGIVPSLWTLKHRRHGAEEQLVVRIEASREHPDDIAGIALFVDAQIAAAQVDAAVLTRIPTVPFRLPDGRGWV